MPHEKYICKLQYATRLQMALVSVFIEVKAAEHLICVMFMKMENQILINIQPQKNLVSIFGRENSYNFFSANQGRVN